MKGGGDTRACALVFTQSFARSAPSHSRTPRAAVLTPISQGGPVQATAAMQASVYGTAFPARQAIEKQLVGRWGTQALCGGLCPLHRAHARHTSPPTCRAPQSAAPAGHRAAVLALGVGGPVRCVSPFLFSHAPPDSPTPVLPGDIYDFGFDTYLGFPGEKEAQPVGTVHTQMEARLGLGAPPTRPGI